MNYSLSSDLLQVLRFCFYKVCWLLWVDCACSKLMECLLILLILDSESPCSLLACCLFALRLLSRSLHLLALFKKKYALVALVFKYYLLFLNYRYRFELYFYFFILEFIWFILHFLLFRINLLLNFIVS